MFDHDIYVPEYDQGKFRYMVARYVKLLIRTRWKCDPGFLTRAELARWGLEDISKDTLPASRLAAMAADSLAAVNHYYMPLCGSSGILETDQDTPVGRLIWKVWELVPPDGGGPSHHGALVTVTDLLKQNKPVDWDAVAQWELLDVIRDNLDQLPHPVKPDRDPRDSDVDLKGHRNVFRRCGSDWTVQYHGSYVFPIKGTNSGATYIHFLLRRPNQYVLARELAAEWDRFNLGRSRDINAGTEVVRTAGSSNDGPKIDADALRQCNEELRLIEVDLAEAQQNNDLAQIDRLSSERQQLADEILKAYRPGGKPMNVGDQDRRLVDRVSRAINRTIVTIQGKDSALGSHLIAFITTGSSCRYKPELETVWET